MLDLWFTGETRNQFILYIGGLFLLLYVVSLLVGYTQRRTMPNAVALTTPNEHEQVHEYILIVKTSLLPYSGCTSTAKVFVQLQGQFHNSPFHQLKSNSVTGEILTRGKLDIFVIHTTDDLGAIDSVGLELVDDSCEKCVWRPSSLEIYAPATKKYWLSDRTPRLMWQRKLECHVMLSEKETPKNREWCMKYIFGLFTQHQWLSVTQGSRRSGSFTPLLNLQLFFCVLALFLAANILGLLIIEDINAEFDITQEKVTGCVLSTLIVVTLSLGLEAVSRNIKPYSKLEKPFIFMGLNELRKRIIELEALYKVDDTVEQKEEKKSQAELVLVDKKGKAKDNKHKLLEDNQLSDYNQNLNGEMEMSKRTKENRSVPFKIICGDHQFSTPLALSQQYARDLLSAISFLFSKTTLDAHVMKECFQLLQESLSKNIFQLLTRQSDLRSIFSGHKERPADKDQLRYLKHEIVFDKVKYTDPCLRSGRERYSSSSPQKIQTYCSHLQETDFFVENHEVSACRLKGGYMERARDEQTNVDQLRNQHKLNGGNEQSFLSEHDTMLPAIVEDNLWYPSSETPLICEERGSLVENAFELYDYCRCRKENCKKCSRVMSVVMGLSHVMVRNSFEYIFEVSSEMHYSPFSKDTMNTLIVDKLGEMVKEFVYDVGAMIEDVSLTVEVDADLLTLQSAAAVITHHAVKIAVDKLVDQEELQQIQNKSKQFINGLVEDAVAEIKVELHLDATVKRMCASATCVALDEVWTQFQDPVFVFAEKLLRETAIQQIKEKCGLEVEESGASPPNIDPIYERLQSASLKWVKNLDELPLSPRELLIQSLIQDFEKKVDKISELFETLSEYSLVEWKIGIICMNKASKLIRRILIQLHKDYSLSDCRVLPSNSVAVLDYLDIYVVQALDSYIERIQQNTHKVLYAVFLKLTSRSIVQQAMHQATDQKNHELKVQRVYQAENFPSNSSELKELTKELRPLRAYLNFVHKDNKKKNEKQLTEHIRKIKRKQKGYVSINLQNILDSYCVVDDLPREYTEKDLFVLEWFVSGDLQKVLPATLKPILVILMLGLTLVAMLYFIVKGAELTTAQSQEWACLTLLSCGLFGLVFEPLKVLFMCVEPAFPKQPDYYR